MKKIVPLSGRLICMPTKPSVWPGRWCSVIPWQKSKLRSSKVFQFLFVNSGVSDKSVTNGTGGKTKKTYKSNFK